MNIYVLMFTEVGKEKPSASSRLRTMTFLKAGG